MNTKTLLRSQQHEDIKKYEERFFDVYFINNTDKAYLKEFYRYDPFKFSECVQATVSRYTSSPDVNRYINLVWHHEILQDFNKPLLLTFMFNWNFYSEKHMYLTEELKKREICNTHETLCYKIACATQRGHLRNQKRINPSYNPRTDIVRYIGMIEGNTDIRYHSHAIYETPDHLNPTEYFNIISNLFNKLPNADYVYPGEDTDDISASKFCAYFHKRSGKDVTSNQYQDNLLI